MGDIVESSSLNDKLIKLEQATPLPDALLQPYRKFFFFHLLLDGMSKRSRRDVSMEEKVNEFASHVAEYVNMQIFGDITTPTMWAVPMEKGELGTIKFANWRMHQILEQGKELIDVCIPDFERSWKWNDVLSLYSLTMNKI